MSQACFIPWGAPGHPLCARWMCWESGELSWCQILLPMVPAPHFPGAGLHLIILSHNLFFFFFYCQPFEIQAGARLTSQVMTSSDLLPPPPLTLAGVTSGTAKTEMQKLDVTALKAQTHMETAQSCAAAGHCWPSPAGTAKMTNLPWQTAH